MSLCRGGRIDREVRHNQPKGQPTVQAANPTTPVTHANLLLIEERFRDMLTETLAQCLLAQLTQRNLV